MRVCSRPRGTRSSPKLRRTAFVTTRPERPWTAQPPCKRLPVPSLTAPSWPGRTGLNPEAASRRRGGRSRSLVAEPRVRGAPRGRARGPGWRGEAQGRHRSAVGCGAGRGGWAVARRGAARGTGDAGGRRPNRSTRGSRSAAGASARSSCPCFSDTRTSVSSALLWPRSPAGSLLDGKRRWGPAVRADQARRDLVLGPKV